MGVSLGSSVKCSFVFLCLAYWHCSQNSTQELLDGSFIVKDPVLNLTPEKATVKIGATLQFAATGGTPPFKYVLGAGDGSVDAATGVYTPPRATGVAVVAVNDAKGRTDWSTVQILPADVPQTGDKVAYTAGLSFNMVYAPAAVYPDGSTDPTIIPYTAIATVADSFFIAETEVTYELWLTVRNWATSNGYVFQNAGVRGNGTSASAEQPVTTVSRRDSIVWLNALTEYYNLQNATNLSALYYKDAGFTTLLKDSTSLVTACDAALNYTDGSCDQPFVKAGAKGFRLPTKNEFYLAARYKGSDSSNGALEHPAGSNKWWHGADYHSGSTKKHGDVPTDVSSYSWHSGNALSTAPVKTRLSNALGIYDMSGNVYEWSESRYSNSHAVMGGSWSSAPASCRVGYTSPSLDSNLRNSGTGLRIAKTP